MHDMLFRAEFKERPNFASIAAPLDIDIGQFQTCLEDTKSNAAGVVERDRGTAKVLGISATPTFLVGKPTDDGRVKVINLISGAKPLDDFKRAIDAALTSTR